MASRFLMQIVDRHNGQVVQFEPKGKVELELVDDCVRRVLQQAPFTLAPSSATFVEAVVTAVRKRGVMLKTEAHVLQDVRDALHEVITMGGFDAEVQAVQDGLETRVRLAIEGAILGLKTQITP